MGLLHDSGVRRGPARCVFNSGVVRADALKGSPVGGPAVPYSWEYWMYPNKPLPIGYVEIQRSWAGKEPPPHIRIPQEQEDIIAQAAREYPQLTRYVSRCEHVVDGAGEEHYTLYVGFAPPIKEGVQNTEPLDPRNLNNADRAEQIGDPARDHNIGAKEQKF